MYTFKTVFEKSIFPGFLALAHYVNQYISIFFNEWIFFFFLSIEHFYTEIVVKFLN